MNPILLLSNTNEEIMETEDEDIIITTREGKIIKVTPQSGEHYGLTPHDLLGKSVLDLQEQGIFNPAITPQVVQKKKKVIMVQTTPNGSRVLITGIPLLNEEQEVEFVISYSYELSQLLVMKDYLKELESEISHVKEELAFLRNQQMQLDHFFSESPSTKRAVNTALKIARYNTPVVISGEHGTGKTSLAAFIHNQSEKRNGPFIEIDCSTIPDAVFDSAFNGTERSGGYVQLAKGGTIVVNEIDQLSKSAQSRIVKILENLESTRIIAVSEENLEEMTRQNSFREDLFYFLHLAPIHLKPLRERPEDLAKIITAALSELNSQYQQEKKLNDPLFLHLMQLEWKGNIREVKNVLERSFLESEQPIISLEDLPALYRPDKDEQIGIEIEGQSLPHILEYVEKKVLLNAQKRFKTTTEMAKILGISQPSVVRKLKKYGGADI
ncbi:sigma 54-interacting transcriptional regulator [Jeotgalibacillus proteolyticus]|uniref:HTH-type transcriptional regulatory protein TyrR n=1 Tax=Jeotgalibacillus proteolyticus TaxID=2082395 RepID=A0A2S5G7L1_9BACL|nr:sigma 54-interacting transcriptional regulator [Jeotgalibacillus proteolyticus]PPA68933.1 Fis family transcriptional regulator [Jeotgalibacillus proteolyticus]